MKVINLSNIIPEAMLIVEHPSNVKYRNRVQGIEPSFEDMEGILVPLGLDAGAVGRIRNCPYATNAQGITTAIADIIDEVLASEPTARFVSVDRSLLKKSWNSWIHVNIVSPKTTVKELYEGYFGAIYGFGSTRGVLTW